VPPGIHVAAQHDLSCEGRRPSPLPSAPFFHPTAKELVMPQENRSPEAGAGFQPVHLTAMALRSAGHLYDLNVSAARVLLQTQARAAAAFGLPDWSPLFDSSDERVRKVFATGAEQVLSTARRANEAVTELQRQVGRVIETQASQAAESWQRGLEQLGSHASEGFDQLCETARRTAEDAQRGAQAFGEQVRDNVREAAAQAAETPTLIVPPSPGDKGERRSKQPNP
jgi:hypothetical protein